jgi:predicted nuclease with TOPRIM domain
MKSLKTQSSARSWNCSNKEKDINEKLSDEKNQLLEFVEFNLADQEKANDHIASLESKNSQLRDQISNIRHSRNSSKNDSETYDDRHNFDTFGGEGSDDAVTKYQMKNEEELSK